jgi:fibronectin-binding autotransporter adhesin
MSFCLVSAAVPASAALLLSYDFNETGTTASAGGSASTGGTPVLNFQSGATTPDLHGGPGSGVSGVAGDRAFDNTSTVGMGPTTNTTGGRAVHAADFDAIDNLTSFTIAGWFKTDSTTPIGNNALLLSNRSGVAGVDLAGDPNTPGALRLRVDNGGTSSTAAFGATQEWVNFAVTYDGTAAQPNTNVFFYAGNKTTPLVAAGSGVNITGAADQDTAPLSIGALKFAFNNNNTSPFDGFIDNLRIWDSVVPLATLEALRISDAGAVPEPATLSLLGIVLLAFGVTRRRQSDTQSNA